MGLEVVGPGLPSKDVGPPIEVGLGLTACVGAGAVGSGAPPSGGQKPGGIGRLSSVSIGAMGVTPQTGSAGKFE